MKIKQYMVTVYAVLRNSPKPTSSLSLSIWRSRKRAPLRLIAPPSKET